MMMHSLTIDVNCLAFFNKKMETTFHRTGQSKWLMHGTTHP